MSYYRRYRRKPTVVEKIREVAAETQKAFKESFSLSSEATTITKDTNKTTVKSNDPFA